MQQHVEEELSLPGMDAWTGDLAGQWPAPAVRAEAGALRAGGPDLAEVAGSAKPPGVVVWLIAAHIVINFEISSSHGTVIILD